MPGAAPCSGCQGHSCRGNSCSDSAIPSNGACCVQLNASENLAVWLFLPWACASKDFQGLKSEEICPPFTGTRWSPSFITRALGVGEGAKASRWNSGNIRLSKMEPVPHSFVLKEISRAFLLAEKIYRQTLTQLQVLQRNFQAEWSNLAWRQANKCMVFLK